MLTALNIGFDINTIVTFSTVGNTTEGLASRASRMITPLLGETLRATSTWEVPTYPIALAVGCLANTIDRICAGRRSVAIFAVKVAWAADATEGTSVVRVATLLPAPLILDLKEEQSQELCECECEEESTHKSAEVVTGTVPTNPVNDLLRHWVAVKEPRENG